VESVHKHIAPGGAFLLDTVNTLSVLSSLNDSAADTVISDRDLVTIRSFDQLAELLHRNLIQGDLDRSLEDSDVVTSRMYYPHEVVEMLDSSGFKLKAVFGDFTGADFSINSPRLIALREKSA
jgi:hypothetical protein